MTWFARLPPSLRNLADLLHERVIEVRHGTVQFLWNRFGSMFAAEIRRKRVKRTEAYRRWRWRWLPDPHLRVILASMRIVRRRPDGLSRDGWGSLVLAPEGVWLGLSRAADGYRPGRLRRVN